MAKVATVLKIRSSLGEKEASDGKRHVASRYIPWFKNEDLAKDPNAVIKQLFTDFTACGKSKTISGLSTEGEVVEEKPFNTTGTGKNGGSPTWDLIAAMLARGFTLVNQQEMHAVLADRYGRTDKVAPGKAPGGPEEDI